MLVSILNTGLVSIFDLSTAICKFFKASLEKSLAETQAALISEKQVTASLNALLNACNEDKAKLEAEKAALINVSIQYN